MVRKIISKEKRFWAKVKKAKGNKCWSWLGAKTRGYGCMRTGAAPGKSEYAHRISYEINIGPIPKGHHVCHHCDNPECCNPKHLFTGTDADNHADMLKKGRELSGEKHPNSKLKEKDILKMRQLYGKGINCAEIGRRFNINRNYAWQICNKQKWRRLA